MVKEAIKKGYKQTEVGVIPEDWGVKKLGDVADITKLAGFEYTNYFNSYKDSGEIVVIRGTNITHNKLDLTDIRTIPRSTSNKLPRSKLSKHDLVFAYVGTIGPVFLIDKNNAYHLGPNTCKLTAKDCISPEFLFSYFTSRLIQNEIVEHTSIGAQPSLSMTKIRKFRVTLPPTKPEQTVIATVLSDTDALIEHLEKLITKKKNIKQGTMQQLLTGKKRLPGFRGDWEVKKLGEIASVVGGGTPSTQIRSYWNGSVNWFTPTEIGLNKYTYGSLRKITNEGLKNSSAKMLPQGTILLTTRAGIGDLSILMNKGCTNQGFQSLIAESDVSDEFLYYLVSTLKNILIQNASGSTFLEISPNNIKQIEVKIPKLAEQIAIASILSDLDAEIESLEQKRNKYTMIKLGMMQQLLTGRIRINVTN